MLLMQEGVLMVSVDLSICERVAVVALRGELDVADAAGVAARLGAVAAPQAADRR